MRYSPPTLLERNRNCAGGPRARCSAAAPLPWFRALKTRARDPGSSGAQATATGLRRMGAGTLPGHLHALLRVGAQGWSCPIRPALTRGSDGSLAGRMPLPGTLCVPLVGVREVAPAVGHPRRPFQRKLSTWQGGILTYFIRWEVEELFKWGREVAWAALK